MCCYSTMVKALNSQQQRTRTLPRSSSAISRGKEPAAKKAKQKVNTKGIWFPNNRPTQEYTQKIILEIIDKWRKSEPKQANGEPPHGSRARIVREYQSVQKKDWLTDNQVRMKWQGIKQQRKKKAASASVIQRSKKKLDRKLSIQTWISNINIIPSIACFLCMLTVNG